MNAKLQRAVCLPIIKSTLGVENKFIDPDIVLRKTYHTRYHSAIPFVIFLTTLLKHKPEALAFTIRNQNKASERRFQFLDLFNISNFAQIQQEVGNQKLKISM